MTPLHDLKDDLAYDLWANSQVLHNLKTVPQRPDQALRLLGHILGAQEAWLSRLLSSSRLQLRVSGKSAQVRSTSAQTYFCLLAPLGVMMQASPSSYLGQNGGHLA